MVDAAKSPTYLVEHYWPGVTAAAFRRSARQVAASVAQLARAGEPIRFLHSTLVPDGEAAFCVLTAASPDLVERAYAAAGVTFERLVEAIESDARVGTPIPVSIGSDPGSTVGHVEQPRTNPTEDEPTWTNAGSPTAR